MKRNQHKRPPEPDVALDSVGVKRKRTSKGTFQRNVIAKEVVGNREYLYHATKGYRSYAMSK